MGGEAFPDGESALMLEAARLRYVSSTKWSSSKYLNMELLNYKEYREALASWPRRRSPLKIKKRKIVDTTRRLPLCGCFTIIKVFMYSFLRKDGWQVKQNRVYRLLCVEGLLLRSKRSRGHARGAHGMECISWRSNNGCPKAFFPCSSYSGRVCVREL